MTYSYVCKVGMATALALLIPLIAMQFSDEAQWTLFDFVFMGMFLFGAGIVYGLIAEISSDTRYKYAAGIAFMTTILLIWINGAVGIIGSEDNPANLLYFVVILVLAIGSSVVRFKPQNMASVLYITAGAQALVPCVAFAIWRPDMSPGVIQVFVLNTFFVGLWIGSGLLFKSVSTTHH